jgi:hypothetical protein
MRLYIKLSLFVAAFVVLSSAATRGAASELAYAVRVKCVLAFGSPADFDALVEDTQRAQAAQAGRSDVYDAGRRYRILVGARLAEAACRNVALTEQDVAEIDAECARETFGQLAKSPVR